MCARVRGFVGVDLKKRQIGGRVLLRDSIDRRDPGVDADGRLHLFFDGRRIGLERGGIDFKLGDPHEWHILPPSTTWL